MNTNLTFCTNIPEDTYWIIYNAMFTVTDIRNNLDFRHANIHTKNYYITLSRE